MFLGQFNHVLDEKGRLAVPSRFRAGLVEGLVITRGTDRCLYVYPSSSWQTIASRLEALPLGDPNARSLRRAAFAAAEPADLDKQGRIVIPERLRQYANLNGSVAVVGMSSYIELWNQATWEEIDAQVEEKTQEIAAHLSGQF